MSQRRFRSAGYMALTGWDRPLQQYFLVIEAEDQDRGGGDGYVYSNLADPHFESDPEFIVRTCLGLGIVPPESLRADLAKDGAVNAGNVILSNTEGGTPGEMTELIAR